jgi:hypothetical protein
MSFNIMISKKMKNRTRKSFAIYLVITILFQTGFPTFAWALTGGPSQPEVQSFEPVSTSDMVDPFSGDFKYNIPLMDVDGYPINIAYHSGVTMDQEASWVGLGWNINAGVINRSMRGLPDDFNGDIVEKEMYMKPNVTFGINAGLGVELIGLPLGINFSMGMRFNNYTGVGVEKSLNLAINSGKNAAGPLNGSLGLTSSSDEGLTIQPNIGFNNLLDKNSKSSITGNLGVAFNSRMGLKTLTIGPSVSLAASKGFSLGFSSSSFDLGMPTYTPQVNMPMENLSITGNFKIGAALFFGHGSFNIGGYKSSQRLATNKISNPAFGYMNADEGVKYDNALMDFNREKDGSFSPNTPALPIPNFTYDVYSVTGQGTGGSYRPFRSDLGHIFDAASGSTSDGYSIGAEVGFGNLNHLGADISVNGAITNSGKWDDDNYAINVLRHKKKNGNNPLYESYYFKEASEKSLDTDPNYFKNSGGFSPVSIKLKKLSQYEFAADNSFNETTDFPNTNYRTKRDIRNQSISTITRGEYSNLASDPSLLDQNAIVKLYDAPKHHIAEITSLGTDGSRYVYGIAAYNKFQNDITFATGTNAEKTISKLSANASDGLVGDYNPTADLGQSNQRGLDNFYSKTTTPAYAHSYLLTAVLSSDYVDSDNSRGPSDGDLGSYTKFKYDKVDNYRWRVPVQQNKASANEGLRSIDYDDKGNIIYGEKEQWYLDKIETKNYVAVFYKEDRLDAYGVLGINGGKDVTQTSKLLRKISLYAKKDFNTNGISAVPLKEVNFKYDYSLCQGAPNAATGKLTLKSISFTYQGSNKGRLSPYEFIYSTNNPSYNMKAYDRWGNYKPSNAGAGYLPADDLSNADYSYVEQDNRTLAGVNATAWALTEVKSPSGGRVTVDYEADDYAYVQNKKAMQMFKVVGFEDGSAISTTNDVIDLNGSNHKLLIKMQDDGNGTVPQSRDDFYNKYIANMPYIYFRFLMGIVDNEETNPGQRIQKYEFVSGYIKRDNISDYDISVTDKKYAWISFTTISTNDNSGSEINPITKAAINYGKLNMSKEVWSSNANTDVKVKEDAKLDKDVAEALAASSFFKNIKETFKGPNELLYSGTTDNKNRVGRFFVINKSWIRLMNPNGKKIGGGLRVKKVSMSDEWYGMSDSKEIDAQYGQTYEYLTEEGISSGVASYEPQLGGDENPWKIPVFKNEKRLLAPDDESYMEEPFGETFFPSPSIGYGRVTIRSFGQKNGKTNNSTGKVVHEFYTAKDYPTIVGKTRIDAIKSKSKPFSLRKLLNLDVKDYMTASQGFSIELNDMHGKPKSQKMYGESQIKPFSSVEYKYKSDAYGSNSFRLNNTQTVIDNSGNVDNNKSIGVFFDFVADTREQKTLTYSGSIQGNLDFAVWGIFPAGSLTGLGSVTSQSTRFRSIATSKVIQRFGILEETITNNEGSITSVKNLAYDAESGEVLLTQTANNFNDPMYSLTVPAYWYYQSMGPAYRNIGFETRLSFNVNGEAAITNAANYFNEGDELYLSNGKLAWITNVGNSSIKAVYRNGDPVNLFMTIPAAVRVVRSGKRNQQSAAMASMTLLTNPINNIKSNVYENVTQASAIEYDNIWRTSCNCFEQSASFYTTNPYVLGTKGYWKNKRSFTYLTERAQANVSDNTDIRKDGIFNGFKPYYKFNGSNWEVDGKDWTFTSEVSEMSPQGMELENKDALGNYSAALYGYNQKLALAVTANSKYKDMAFDNFEDYLFSLCADNHFKFRKIATGNATDSYISAAQAHSGKKSIRVLSNTEVSLTKQLLYCDLQSCDLELTSTLATNVYDVTITKGTAPYNVKWNIIYGNPLINTAPITPAIGALTISGTGYELELIVTDSRGCKQIRIFKN